MNFRGPRCGDVYVYTLSNGEQETLTLLDVVLIDDDKIRWLCLSRHGITQENRWVVEHNVATHYYRLLASLTEPTA